MLTEVQKEALRASANERRKETVRKARERISTIVGCQSLLAEFMADADPAVLDDLIVKMRKLKPTDLRFFQKAIEATQQIHTVVNDQYYVIGSSTCSCEWQPSESRNDHEMITE